MTRETALLAVATILTTVAETTTGGQLCPKSAIYLALQHGLRFTHDDCDGIIGLMVSSDLIVATAETLRLTAKGESKAQEINAITKGK